jgi:anti-sigma B factor antagonist
MSGNGFELLHTELERHGDTIVVVASGEIDLSSAGRLEAQLRRRLDCADEIVVDLRQVSFIDSSGLHCMLDIHTACCAAGVAFGLIPGPPQVQRVFQVTRTEKLLRFVEPAGCVPEPGRSQRLRPGKNKRNLRAEIR